MIQIVYMSFATQNFKSNRLVNTKRILDKAAINNKQLNITGMLIYKAGIFLQILEGKRTDVETLMGRIVFDKSNHENIKVLLKQNLEERVFPNWSMAYKEIDNSALSLIESVLPWQKIAKSYPNDDQVPAVEILKIFKNLKASL